ncbi:hypothetical protein [Alloscardovia macacae]|uniref:Fic/DOC family n=1 Tax=Alloscardovia macacae TaxID=1160091 RepID=A0A261F6V8_9BIFI|nr:hypothetical protein [Alloscardovia macacae]OZG54763.1 fic/DOC family [Alloscardovia macacae]
MAPKYEDIEELLHARVDIHARLQLLPYNGFPEIKEPGDGRYLYTSKRVAGKLTSTYAGAYTEDLYNLLLRNAHKARSLRKELRRIEKELSQNRYTDSAPAPDILGNRDFAREFILDNDVLYSRTDYSVLSHTAQLVNEGFFAQGGRIRGVPVTIGRSSYVPKIPFEADV